MKLTDISRSLLGYAYEVNAGNKLGEKLGCAILKETTVNR